VKPAGVLMAFVFVVFLAILSRPDGSEPRRERRVPTPSPTPTVRAVAPPERAAPPGLSTAGARAVAPPAPLAPPEPAAAPGLSVARPAPAPDQGPTDVVAVFVLSGLAVCLSGAAVAAARR